MKELVEVVWPLGRCVRSAQPLAQRLDTLEGKTVCGLFNGGFYFDQTWPLVKQLLIKRYPSIKFFGWEEFGLLCGKEESQRLEALPKKLAQYGCDAVISGRGC